MCLPTFGRHTRDASDRRGVAPTTRTALHPGGRRMDTGREWRSGGVIRPAYTVDKFSEFSIRPEPGASRSAQELNSENFIQIRGRSETHMTSNGSLTGPLTKERKNMASRLRGRLSLIFLTVLVAMLAFPAMAFAEPLDSSGGTSPAPTIQSDQADYSPGATVTLTGSNWQPGESVNINVNDDEG